MNSTQILFERRKTGDISTVAEMLGENYHNTWKILNRPNSKKHNAAIEALRKVIEARELLKKDIVQN
ncbi:MAG: hypothetical protein PF489_02590 [Salinivirgaceae bacterium]|jgi:hypothetical protein|nr:hypothetical protein [Salinivirgaceae bacterium]